MTLKAAGLSLLLFVYDCASGPPSGAETQLPIEGASAGGEIDAMISTKLDKRLLEEIQIRREIASSEGKNMSEAEQGPYSVTIELAETLSISRGGTREEDFKELERRVSASQEGLIAALQELNVDEYERQVLSNSISTTLTLDQMQEIAKRGDVKMIRLVKVEKIVP